MPSTVYVTQMFTQTAYATSGVSPALDAEYWGVPNQPVPLPEGDAVQVLWMDRDVGIKDGDTWVFTTSVDVGGTTVLLQEQVTGTAFSSTIQIQIQAGTQNTGWQSQGASLGFQGADGNQYEVVGGFNLPPGNDYDNVNYKILPG